MSRGAAGRGAAGPAAAGLATVLLTVVLAATPAVAAPLPLPVPSAPAPDPAALARLRVAPDAVAGARPVGPCPAGVAPTALDAFGGGGLGGADAPLPGAGAGVTVAVVDTGVAPHPRLAGRVADGGDFVADASALDDCDGHGTAVAGVLAAASAPTDLVAGLVPAARILAVRQTSTWVRPPRTAAAGDVATLARAVRAATRPGVGVMTLALAACVAPDRVADPVLGPALGALRAALGDAADAGVVVVAAAGSTGVPGGCAAPGTGSAASLPVPGWFGDDVLTVGAAAGDAADPTSLPGPWVDLGADGRVPAGLDARGPGLTVALTTPDAAPAPLEGSSFAVARVAGVAAALRARDPALPARAVAARLTRTARSVGSGSGSGPGAGAALGAGLLDAAAALDPAADAAADPVPADPPTTDPAVPTGVLVVVLVVVLVGGAVVAGTLTRRARRRGRR